MPRFQFCADGDGRGHVSRSFRTCGPLGMGSMMLRGIMGREMDEHEERAFKYRQKAEEVRAMIPDMNDRNIRETLEKIAADYDILAGVQDSLARLARKP